MKPIPRKVGISIIKVPIGITGEELSGKKKPSRVYVKRGGEVGSKVSADRVRREKLEREAEKNPSD